MYYDSVIDIDVDAQLGQIQQQSVSKLQAYWKVRENKVCVFFLSLGNGMITTKPSSLEKRRESYLKKKKKKR